MFLTVAHPFLFFGCLAIVALLICYRLWWYQAPRYRHSMGRYVRNSGTSLGRIRARIFFLLRLLLLAILALLIAKPQLVDDKQKVHVEGIDIMLVLDVSGSMDFIDDEADGRSRIQVAKDEAQRFINKRTNDAMGLVLFGADAVSRVPLTMDKKILEQVVRDIDIHTLFPQGTALATGIAMGANRLRSSASKSKIMIVLTDGQPTGKDLNPDDAIALAREVGVKIYTVGIGDESTQVIHPFWGAVTSPLNKPLLIKIADKTGGTFFEAKKPQDMARIYDEIDRLETVSHDVDVLYPHYDFFMPFLWFALFVLIGELIFSLLWFGL